MTINSNPKRQSRDWKKRTNVAPSTAVACDLPRGVRRVDGCFTKKIAYTPSSATLKPICSLHIIASTAKISGGEMLPLHQHPQREDQKRRTQRHRMKIEEQRVPQAGMQQIQDHGDACQPHALRAIAHQLIQRPDQRGQCDGLHDQQHIGIAAQPVQGGQRQQDRLDVIAQLVRQTGHRVFQQIDLEGAALAGVPHGLIVHRQIVDGGVEGVMPHDRQVRKEDRAECDQRQEQAIGVAMQDGRQGVNVRYVENARSLLRVGVLPGVEPVGINS